MIRRRTSLTIKGKDLMMHNRRLRNNSDPLTRKMRLITLELMGTSDPDERVRLIQKLADLEWEAGMYYDDKVGPYLPAEMLHAALRSGFESAHPGRRLPSSIRIIDNAPLKYTGPRKLEELRGNPDFIDQREVKVPRQKRRVLRTRPIFKDWEAVVPLEYSPKQLRTYRTDFAPSTSVKPLDTKAWDRQHLAHCMGKCGALGSGRHYGFGVFFAYPY